MTTIATYLPSGHPTISRATPQPAAATPPPPPIGPNPRLRLEPALGVVVTEFLDAAGQVTRSAPSEAQLQAYRDSLRR